MSGPASSPTPPTIPRPQRCSLACTAGENSGDAELLAQPAARVYSRGDANLLNWLHDWRVHYVADFEFSGFSDIAIDAADHIEQIGARFIPDEVWAGAEATSASRRRTAPGSRPRSAPSRCAGSPCFGSRAPSGSRSSPRSTSGFGPVLVREADS